MRKKKQASDTGVAVFKRLYGVKPDTFEKMKGILQKEFDVLHKNGGKPPKLTVENKLYIALKYLREYRTMESIWRWQKCRLRDDTMGGRHFGERQNLPATRQEGAQAEGVVY